MKTSNSNAAALIAQWDAKTLKTEFAEMAGRLSDYNKEEKKQPSYKLLKSKVELMKNELDRRSK